VIARTLLAAALALVTVAPAGAQDHSGHAMPAPGSACSPEHAAMGHCTPEAAPAADTPARADVPDCPPEHAAMGHCTPAPAAPADPQALGTALPAGNAPAPPAPRADYAERIWGREAMAPVREALRREHGGMSFSQIMVDIAEVQVRQGREGYRWEAEGWFGGDINRLVIKTEGEGDFGGALEDAEVQALYSRAIGPYFNLQAGVRQDFEPASRTYAAFGVEGLAPYWFEIEAHGFVSTDGEVLARLAASYDQRITQRLILQPRAEFNFAAQDVRASGIGSGLSDAEFDLRLRYEIVREFAPYIGISHSAKLGRTADFARAAGEDPSTTSFVVGVRAWF
jgi:copper resistance protein B